jgi:hypothetical protein
LLAVASKYVIELSEVQERELRRRAAQYTRPHREVVRARIVLLAAEGHTNAEIARRLDCTEKSVCKCDDGSMSRASWGSMNCPGRGVVPGRFPPAQVAEIKALACELPAESGRPLSRWSGAEIANEAVERGIVCSISGTTVWRYSAEDAIRPWAWRSWIFPRDPAFADKAGRVLDLYERRWESKRLHPGVICADEKSQLQALLGRHDPVAPAPGRPGLQEFEYTRLGTLAYLAALDVHDPRRGLFGRCEAKTGIEPFGRLVEQVMTSEPYASAQRVFWVVDNGSSHAGQRSIECL